MKKGLFLITTGILIFSGIISPELSYSQSAAIKKYLTRLPSGKPVDKGNLEKYTMTAVYTNRDLYGNFTGKTKVSGEYSRGLGNSQVKWNNVRIGGSNNPEALFSDGVRQEYMENMTYIPSPEMLKEDTFKNFPRSTENVFARNLIWDMMTIEGFAWDYSDSLQLNRKYIVPDIKGEFNMADIGKYEHASIQLCWTGISLMNNELCAVIEYRAIDNKIEIGMDQIKTRGTEQYWGTTWISLKSKQIEHAEMYGGTIQEIEVTGLKDKFLVKTIRELWVDRIQ
jgi:hypothetical protein